MSVRLTIKTAMWRAHVASVASRVAGHDVGLVPVVKGNGYGFGRRWLAEMASELADTIAVGTVHELDGVTPDIDVTVLTPVVRPVPAAAERAILTIGSRSHLDAVAGRNGRVVVKIASPMRRYGVDPTEADALIDAARSAGHEVVGVSIHPPLAGTSRDHLAAIAAALEGVDAELTIWISHVDVDDLGHLPAGRRYALRLGTALWHGDKSVLHLEADVLETRRVAAGDQAGYRATPVAGDGHLVMIGAGTAHGVTPLPDGRSPFHFARRRLDLLEPPHMHTSMAFVPDGADLPAVGDHVDVQRPLHMTHVDEYVWR